MEITTRVPLSKRGVIRHRTKKGKGSYRRNPKHRQECFRQHEMV